MDVGYVFYFYLLPESNEYSDELLLAVRWLLSSSNLLADKEGLSTL